jgi:parallel beta-helix repeat protein
VADWLYPHENDDGQWVTQHGAGVHLKGCTRATIRRVRARDVQNGIILDRVTESRIYDSDCSFLSGWGFAMWRSSRNVITRNAFDFCIRGYSHGVYNRGQDSAGILMFEQNNENIIAENSATHCGDGLFGFGGKESLSKPRRTGNNANLIINNDLSYAAAHGIEMTFSFDNSLIGNRLVENAICGVWGGYSQDTLISGNKIVSNGQAGYGKERGGINIEHGHRNVITHNTFRQNRCGIRLWWDDDGDLLARPWTKANEKGSSDNVIADNTFTDANVAIELRRTTNTRLGDNRMIHVATEVDADADSSTIKMDRTAPVAQPFYVAFGDSRPIRGRDYLAGRDKIFITGWGPYNFEGVSIFPSTLAGSEESRFYALAPSGKYHATVIDGRVALAAPVRGALPARLTVEPKGLGYHPFQIDLVLHGHWHEVSGTFFTAPWEVRFYRWSPGQGPREHEDAWKDLIKTPPIHKFLVSSIDFNWPREPVPNVPPDRFGTVAETNARLPAGRYAIRTISDDGLRVWVDGRLVIDDWTWHAPREHSAELHLNAGLHKFRIEHFEIDGYARLKLTLEPVR